jgi:hypothetical protein
MLPNALYAVVKREPLVRALKALCQTQDFVARHVRNASLATLSDPEAACREGPGADSCTATKLGRF